MLVALLATAWAGVSPSLAPAFPADTCAECRADAAGATLCAPHAEAERAALELLADDIGDGNAERAGAALQALAALTAFHENVPSERVAAALARGLDHENCSVRRSAVQLLTSGQHVAASSSAFSDAIRAFPRESAALRKAYEKEKARYEKDRARRKPWSELSEEERLEADLESSRLASVRNDAWFEYADHADFGLALAEALAKRDDAGVDGLILLCDALGELDFGQLRLVQALLHQGRQDAVKRALAFLAAWQAEQLDLEKELARFEHEYAKAEKKAGTSPGARTWLSTERGMLELRRTNVEGGEKFGRRLHDAFAAMVRERDLGVPPEWDGRPHLVWSAWLRRHQNELPRRLDPAPVDD
ncbi:MAG TPA: hypothetical protein VMT18_11505 [Planctomycetota bacterium]|nr:hypothetical protein [Planctomycetota bacterium]